jgi:hypothetical protein
VYTLLQSFLQVALPLTVLLVLVVFLAIARPDHDDTGDGIYAVYLSVAAVTALYLMLIFGVAGLNAVAQRVLVDRPPQSAQDFGNGGLTGVTGLFLGGEEGDPDLLVQQAVLSGLMALGAGIVFVFHVRRRSELAASEDFAGSAGARVDRAYLAAVCFIAIVIGIPALGFLGHGALRLVAPGVTGSIDTFEEQQGVAQLISFGALLAACIALFQTHFWSVRSSSESEADPEPDAIDID